MNQQCYENYNIILQFIYRPTFGIFSCDGSQWMVILYRIKYLCLWDVVRWVKYFYLFDISTKEITFFHPLPPLQNRCLRWIKIRIFHNAEWKKLICTKHFLQYCVAEMAMLLNSAFAFILVFNFEEKNARKNSHF